MDIPPVGVDGRRVTVNSNLDEDDTLWNFRSAWNVAALNCLEGHHQPILDGYGGFLKKYSRALSRANTAIDKRFREEAGSRSAGIKAREAYMTQVYNYLAMPPVRGSLCEVALQAANEFTTAPPEDPKLFAASYMPRLEAAFESFFRAYEQYRVDSAAWDAKWGARYGSSQPGYVAVHGTAGPTIATSLAEANTQTVVGEVLDPESGARIPLIAAPEEEVATPVVQPVPEGAQR